jgi:carboxypeptidase Q
MPRPSSVSLSFATASGRASRAPSPFLRAVSWAESTWRADGLEVRLEPVTTQLWVRGRERALMTLPVKQELSMLGIGDSVGTGGIEAPVLRVQSMEELGPQVKGKIVLFDPPIPAGASGVERYRIYIPFRVHGPSRAATYGAVAVLVRSQPVHSLGTAHTGTLSYDPSQPKIPAATVSFEHGGWMARLLEAGQEVRVRLEMEAHDGGPVKTANVVAELKGTEHPEEIVLIGAHLV